MRPPVRAALSVVAALLLAGNSAHADQCAYIKADTAEALREVLSAGDTVADYCAPCGEAAASAPYQVRALTVAPVPGAAPYLQATLNGRGIDLAYTYVKRPSGIFTSLAHLSGCPVEDSPAVLPSATTAAADVRAPAAAPTAPAPLPQAPPPAVVIVVETPAPWPWLLLCSGVGVAMLLASAEARRRRASSRLGRLPSARKED